MTDAERAIAEANRLIAFHKATAMDDRVRRIEAFAGRLLPDDLEARAILVVALLERSGLAYPRRKVEDSQVTTTPAPADGGDG